MGNKPRRPVVDHSGYTAEGPASGFNNLPYNNYNPYGQTNNNNSYNYEPPAPPIAIRRTINFKNLRPVVIDGSNVAMQAGKNGRYNCRAILLAAKYFIERGHRVYAFVPKFRRDQNPDNPHKPVDDQWLLKWMENHGLVVLTPSRQVRTDDRSRRHIVCHDDNMIIQYAHMCGGVILSNDNFRDVSQNQPEWTITIQRRLLMFTWVDDQIMIPIDPLGRNGPHLDVFLQYQPGERVPMDASKFMDEEQCTALLQEICDILQSSNKVTKRNTYQSETDFHVLGSLQQQQLSLTPSGGVQANLFSTADSSSSHQKNTVLPTNNSLGSEINQEENYAHYLRTMQQTDNEQQSSVHSMSFIDAQSRPSPSYANFHSDGSQLSDWSSSQTNRNSQALTIVEIDSVVSALSDAFPINIIRQVMQDNPGVMDLNILANLISDAELLNDAKLLLNC